MRIGLGLLLIVLSLIGGYLILTGKFPPTAVNSGTSGTSAGTSAGALTAAIGSTGGGSGGESLISHFTHIIPSVYAGNDMDGSRGGYHAR